MHNTAEHGMATKGSDRVSLVQVQKEPNPELIGARNSITDKTDINRTKSSIDRSFNYQHSGKKLLQWQDLDSWVADNMQNKKYS